MPTPDSALIRASCSLTLASERDVASRLLVSMLRSTVEIPHRVEGVQRFLAQLRDALPRGAQHPTEEPFEGAHVVLRRRYSLRVASIDSPMAWRWSESDWPPCPRTPRPPAYPWRPPRRPPSVP
ncbi:hypothetical protein P4056_14805 [Pseudomonas aeruginosa]|nr:hypothetical protein [Pseudomonas aeruginosa]